MAIAVDATSNSGALSAASSATFSHTCSGSDLILIVTASARGVKTDTNTTVTGVTYNGVNLTKIRADTQDAPAADTFRARTEIWYLVGPATGANNIVVTWTGSTSYAGASGLSLTGVVQGIGAVDSSGGAGGTALTLTASTTVVASGCYIVDAVYSRSGTLTVDASQTTVSNISQGGGDDRTGSSYKSSPGTGSRSMTWTESNDGNDWVMTVASIAPSTTAATTINRLIMRGIIAFPN